MGTSLHRSAFINKRDQLLARGAGLPKPRPSRPSPPEIVTPVGPTPATTIPNAETSDLQISPGSSLVFEPEPGTLSNGQSRLSGGQPDKSESRISLRDSLPRPYPENSLTGQQLPESDLPDAKAFEALEAAISGTESEYCPSEELVKLLIRVGDPCGKTRFDAQQIFGALKKRLVYEDNLGPVCGQELANYGSSLDRGPQEQTDCLTALLRTLVPFDVQEFNALAEETLASAQRLVDKDVFLLLGHTGAGKSTTIQLLAGSVMEETKVATAHGDLPHIAVRKFAQLEGQDLRKVALSPHATSCTRFIHAVEFTYYDAENEESHPVILCDTPGLMDSRGVEVDVANQFGVAQAARACRSVVPLVLLSEADMGGRLAGLKGLAGVLSEMFTNFQASHRSLQFLFSKYPDTTEAKKKLKSDVKEANSYLNDRDKADPNFVLFYKRLAAATDRIERTNIVAPLRPSNRDQLMAAILGATDAKIEAPGEAFALQLSAESRAALTRQAQKSLEKIKDFGLKKGEYHIVERQLNHLLVLRERIEQGFLDARYREAVDAVQDFIRALYDDCSNQTAMAASHFGPISEEQIQGVKGSKSKVQRLAQVLGGPGHGAACVDPASFDALLSALAEKYRDKIQEESKVDENLVSKGFQHLLQSVRLIKTHCPDNKAVSAAHDRVCGAVQERFNAIASEGLGLLQADKLLEAAGKWQTMTELRSKLRDFTSESAEEKINQLRDKMKSSLEGKYKAAMALLEALDASAPQDDIQRDLKEIQDHLQHLTAASEVSLFRSFFEEGQCGRPESLTGAIVDYFQGILAQTRATLSGQNSESGGTSLESFQNLKSGMKMLKQIQEIVTLPARNVNDYYRLTNDIVSQIESSVRSLEVAIQSGYSLSVPVSNGALLDNLNKVEGLLWVDEFSGQDRVAVYLADILSAVEKYVAHIVDSAAVASADWEFGHLAACYRRLQGLERGERFRAPIAGLKALVTASVAGVLREITDTAQNDRDFKSFSKYERHLEFFEKAGDHLGDFGATAKQLSLSRATYEENLEYTARRLKLAGSAVTLESEAEVIRVADMMETLSGLASNSRLKRLGGALNFWQVLEENRTELGYLQGQKLHGATELADAGATERLEALRDAVQKAAVLDRYIRAADPTATFTAVLGKISALLAAECKTELAALEDLAMAGEFEGAGDHLLRLGGLPGLQARGLTFLNGQLRLRAGQLDSAGRLLHSSSGGEQFARCCEQIGTLDAAVCYFQSAQTTNPGLFGRIPVQSAERCILEAKARVREAFDSISDHVYGKIKALHVESAELKALDGILASAQQILEPGSVAKAGGARKALSARLEEVTQEYSERPIAGYPGRPLKSLLERLGKLSDDKGLDSVASHIDCICASVEAKLGDRLAILRAAGASLEKGMQNEGLLELRKALKSLPADMAKGLEQDITALEAEYQLQMRRQATAVKVNLGSARDPQSVLSFIKECRSNSRFEEIQEVEGAVQAILGAHSRSIQGALEGREEAEALCAAYEGMLRYKSLAPGIALVGQEIDQANRSISDRLAGSSRVISSINEGVESLTGDRVKLIQTEASFLLRLSQRGILAGDKVKFSIEKVQEAALKFLRVRADLQKKGFDRPLEEVDAKVLGQFLDSLQKLGDLPRVIQELARPSDNGPQHAVDELIEYPEALQQLRKKVEEYINVFEQGIASPLMTFARDQEEHYKKVSKGLQVSRKLASLGNHVIEVGFNNGCVQSQALPATLEGHLCDRIAATLARVDTLLEAEILQAQFAKAPEVATLVSHLQVLRCEFGGVERIRVAINLDPLEAKVLANCKKAEETFAAPGSPVDLDSLATSLLEAKRLSDELLPYKKALDAAVDRILEGTFSRKDLGSQVSLQGLTEKLESRGGDARMRAAHIINEHPAFKANRIAYTNGLIHNPDFGLEYVLRKLAGKEYACKGDKLTSGASAIDKDSLRGAYNVFLSTYGEWDETAYKFTGLLGGYLKTKPDYTALIQAAKALLPSPLGLNLQLTGRFKREGLPRLLAHIFAFWTVKAAEGHLSAQQDGQTKKFLLTPHAAQVISVLRILGLGTSRDKDTTGLIRNHLAQILTGEGKSVTMAATATVLALFGMDVYCACYSEHLSRRDRGNFQELFDQFGVAESVKYGTLEELCEAVINENGNVRDAVLEVLGSNGKPVPVPRRNRPRILFVDEVDTYFSKEFHGALYQPAAVLRAACVQELLRYIWAQRETALTLGTVQRQPVYEACVTAYPKWIGLIDEGIRAMIADLKEMELQPAQGSYRVGPDCRIGYVYGDRVRYNISLGYLTYFAYLKEQEAGRIPKEVVDANIGLRISCGSFSYSKIATEFQAIIGVTGTLSELGDEQRKIMVGELKISEETYTPSVFGDNKLYFPSATNVHVEAPETYFQRLQNLIAGGLEGAHGGQRAVLVFFADEKALLAFRQEQARLGIAQSPYLTEAASSEQIQAVVKQSTAQGQVTLFVRSYGRGTDFLVLDPRVIANGGVCTIQTFPSAIPAEQVQVMGRSARQGQPGSYCLIVQDTSLEEFSITADAIRERRNAGGSALYDLIQAQTKKSFDKTSASDRECAKNADEEHRLSKEFLKELFAGNLQAVSKFLIARNKGPAADPCKTMILIDATGSMSGLIQQTKQTVAKMLDRVGETLAAHRISPDIVMMKIAFYRNYSSGKDLIFQSSAWESDKTKLQGYLQGISASGGQGAEAVEVGLYHALKEAANGLSQVLLIGDAPPNSPDECARKAALQGREYWEQAFPGLTPHEPYVVGLRDRKIPVHALYLCSSAKAAFEKIAAATGGRVRAMDVDAADAAETLTGVVAELILKSAGGEALGDTLVRAYRRAFAPAFAE